MTPHTGPGALHHLPVVSGVETPRAAHTGLQVTGACVHLMPCTLFYQARHRLWHQVILLRYKDPVQRPFHMHHFH